MSINYDEVISELRACETQLQEELKQVQDAIPAMIVLRNKSKGTPMAQPARGNEAKGSTSRKFARMGPTEAIPAFLRHVDPAVALTTREVLDGLSAGGWATKSPQPMNIVRSTMKSLAEKGIVEKVGEAWKLKQNTRVSLNPSAFLTTEQQPPVTQ